MTAQNKVQTKSVGGAIQTASNNMVVTTKYSVGDIVLFDGNRKGKIVSFEIRATLSLIHITYKIHPVDDPPMSFTLRYESEIVKVIK